MTKAQSMFDSFGSLYKATLIKFIAQGNIRWIRLKLDSQSYEFQFYQQIPNSTYTYIHAWDSYIVHFLYLSRCCVSNPEF